MNDVEDYLVSAGHAAIAASEEGFERTGTGMVDGAQLQRDQPPDAGARDGIDGVPLMVARLPTTTPARR
jgi:hypothetical protein